MNRALVIARREFTAYWLSPIAYVVLGLFLFLNSYFYLNPMFFRTGVATAQNMFNYWGQLFIFFIPAVTMRLWAEERKQGTLELLLTYPAKVRELVLGKFLAALAFIGLGVILTLPAVFTVAHFGDLDWGPVVGGYLGGILMVSAYLSLGLFFSSLTENQIVAFLLTLFALLVLNLSYFIQIWESGNIPYWITWVLSLVGLGDHFLSLAKGVVSSQDVLYYLAFTAFFLWMNALVLEAKKWRG